MSICLSIRLSVCLAQSIYSESAKLVATKVSDNVSVGLVSDLQMPLQNFFTWFGRVGYQMEGLN